MTKEELKRLICAAEEIAESIDYELIGDVAMQDKEARKDAYLAYNNLQDCIFELNRIDSEEEKEPMSTHDVPGANPANGDALATGCWAEHSDGSLIFVEGCEGGTVIYSVFDVSGDKPLEYRDSMTELAFKNRYTKDGWTWHDKTGFPWQRIFDNFSPGSRYASADDHLNAAQRIARHRNLAGHEPDQDEKANWLETIAAQATRHIMTGVQKALKDLRP